MVQAKTVDPSSIESESVIDEIYERARNIMKGFSLVDYNLFKTQADLAINVRQLHRVVVEHQDNPPLMTLDEVAQKAEGTVVKAAILIAHMEHMEGRTFEKSAIKNMMTTAVHDPDVPDLNIPRIIVEGIHGLPSSVVVSPKPPFERMRQSAASLTA